MLIRLSLALAIMAVNTPVGASCDAQALYDLKFANQSAATLNYTGNYSYPATSPSGQSSNVGIGFQTYNLASSLILLSQFPQISNTITNGVNGNYLVIGGSFAARTTNITANARVIVTTISFATPVRDVTISISDVDQSTAQFRDWLYFVGKNGANSYAPTITTPFGQVNNGKLTDPSSTVKLGPSAAPVAIGASEAVGISTNSNGTRGGDLALSFAQPVTSVDIRYGNYPLQGLELLTGSQLFGISGISFCPMPVIQVSKSATPFVATAGDPQRFAAPGSDMVYAVTVTNAGSSPVDASTLILSDPLPPQVSFFNGDVDGSGPLTTNYQFDPGTSGLTFAGANLQYSNNGGTSYGYTPATGYDPNVTALKFAPSGTLAPNSSFSIRFRARIN